MAKTRDAGYTKHAGAAAAGDVGELPHMAQELVVMRAMIPRSKQPCT